MSQIDRYLTEIARCGTQYRADNFSELGLRSCHSCYLTRICENPGISQDGLARLTCINKSNVARQIAVLEEDGFVIRKSCETDKRVWQLYPTEKTLKILPRLYDVMRDWEVLLTEDLSDGEREVLAGLLERMRVRAVDFMEHR